MTEHERYLEELKERARKLRELSRRTALEIVDREGKVYSAELKRELGTSTTYARRILNELEREGTFTSWIQSPPHADCPRSGLRRRYYARSEPGAIERE